MSLLNPSTSNFSISFSTKFYDENIDKKYNDYLFHSNSPIKDIGTLIIESVQSVNVSGFEFQEITVNNMGGSNGFNKTFAGTSNETEILESQSLQITFRNNLINWMRMFEFAKAYYARNRTVDLFDITITFMNSGGLPMMIFNFIDCYISGIPSITFANNTEFNDAKTFDAKISYARFEPKFAIPKFKKTNIELTK
jgi:hypothetical protein